MVNGLIINMELIQEPTTPYDEIKQVWDGFLFEPLHMNFILSQLIFLRLQNQKRKCLIYMMLNQRNFYMFKSYLGLKYRCK
jgi:hypothetical protein